MTHRSCAQSGRTNTRSSRAGFPAPSRPHSSYDAEDLGKTALTAALCCCALSVAHAQSTQGLIAGRVVNVRDANPIPRATIGYTQLETNNTGARGVSPDGVFALPLLPPGTYRLRVEAPDFQAQELHQLRLKVAGTIDLVFHLRPLADVWEQHERHNIFLPGNTVLVFFGPDVDLSRTTSLDLSAARDGILESTVSQVVDPVLIRDLPLAGRDVYAVLATQPGVTSDAPTSRGLALSVNGQRPSSANFLLDGLQNNNYLLSGPLTSVAPEAIQEYRVSTSNFSAEYGGTAGVVANAVTRSGSVQLHGLAYLYLKNDALNANDFQSNLAGEPRTPLKQFEPGFFAGGPLKLHQLFGSAAFETLRFRSRSGDQAIVLPSTQFLNQLSPDSLAAQMFKSYAPLPVQGTGPCILGQGVAREGGCSRTLTVNPPSSLDQTLALGRIDKLFRDGTHRLLFRTLVARVSRPDFLWNPYPGFTTPLHQNASSLALAYTGALGPGLTLEARSGFSMDDVRFDRANPQVPGLYGPSGMLLPSSSLYYAFRNRTHNLENAAHLTTVKNNHILKVGSGLLQRRIDGYQTTGRDGYYSFPSASALANSQPSSVSIAVLRSGPASLVPDFNRQYADRRWFGYFQGTWRATSRLTVNYGVRYDNFGTPENIGRIKDTAIQLTPGNTLAAALRLPTAFTMPASGDQRLYSAHTDDWAGRAGFAYSVGQTGLTVLRGAYGIFYDPPFDNLWETLRNNSIQLATRNFNGSAWNYLQSPRAVPGALDNASVGEIFPTVTLFQPGLRTPYVQSFFLGVRRIFTRNLSVEVNGLGALGRELIATDIVNRGLLTRVNTSLPDISYRSNQGNSHYYAGTALAGYRGRSQYLQVGYTWSHSIDNQSDALAGEYGDLGFAGLLAAQNTTQAAFTRQYDSAADRGSSSFDQRHSLVALGTVQFPPPARARTGPSLLLRDWRASWLSAFRSGFPFTVYAPTILDLHNPRLINNRANLADPDAAYAHTPVPGGVLLLNSADFSRPAAGLIGNSGRNAFVAPGFWNVDFSLSRTFPLPHFGESGRVVLRADAFNVFNHANLGAPDALTSDKQFGIATYGRQGYDTGFPAAVPFRETARQIQLMFRVEF